MFQTKAVLFQPASEFLPMINEVRVFLNILMKTNLIFQYNQQACKNFQVFKTLLETTKSTPGAKVENNKFCVSVHFRCVEEKVHKYI